MSDPVPLRYRAFLSYAHVDNRWAKKLHGQLETFRVDDDLVGRQTKIGPVPRSLSPIFRDRQDFSGGVGLTDATIAALDQSAALIVLCSTVSARRPAVQEEVRLFRSRHPERRLIPVIVEGTYPDNFPPALRYELNVDGSVSDRSGEAILGPDLRESADGTNLGLAKVIAGLTVLDTDLIFRRAERARRRRRRLVVGAILSVLVVVSVLAAWAEIQRRRFANYLELATGFEAFEVTDVTQGWDNPRELARNTLAAVSRVVSDLRVFRGVRILWFDDKPRLSSAAKVKFRDAMRGVGVSIREVNDISVAKTALRERYDVVIANFGSPKDNYAYQLLLEIGKHGLDTPVVIYGLENNSRFAREARCFGAVARVTTIDTLFSAVMRSLAPDTRPWVTDRLRQQCIEEDISPYDTPEWRHWLEETKAGRTTAMPETRWR